jgi:hypothetical protein
VNHWHLDIPGFFCGNLKECIEREYICKMFQINILALPRCFNKPGVYILAYMHPPPFLSENKKFCIVTTRQSQGSSCTFSGFPPPFAFIFSLFFIYFIQILSIIRVFSLTCCFFLFPPFSINLFCIFFFKDFDNYLSRKGMLNFTKYTPSASLKVVSSEN